MGGEWREDCLGEIADFKNGNGLKASEYREDGLYPVWGANGSIARTNHVQNHDPVVVIGRVGAYCGSVHCVSEPSWVTDNAIIAKAKPGTDFGFLYYLLKNSNLERTSIGSAQPLVTQSGLKTLPCFVPADEAEQQAIAHILGSLDNKIELNRQLNQTLEQMAQAIFKSWFIDFDPVVYNAVQAGNPVPERFQATAERYRQHPDIQTLPQHILDLFPDRFEESELGEIPAGWDPTTVGEKFDVTMGQSPPGSTYNEAGEGLPFFQGRRDFSFRFPGYRVFCSEPKRIANAGDTLISVRAPVGDINMAQAKSCIGRGVAAVRHKSGYRSFTYYSMQSLGEHFLSYEGEGTVFGSINKKQFSKLPHTSPPQVTIDNFESLVSGLDDHIENNLMEGSYLANFRDTLLPKLISGELRVPDPENCSLGVT